MHPKEIEVYFDTALERPVRLILDADASTWPAVRDLAAEIMERLYGRVEGVSFMGSYDFHKLSLPAEFDRAVAGIQRQNGARPALLNPVLESWQRQRVADYMIVIAGRRPIDLDDWLAEKVLESSNLFFVNLGPAAWGGAEDEIFDPHPLPLILERTANPLAGAFISGPGFFPLQVKAENGQPVIKFLRPEVRLELRDIDISKRFSLYVKALAVSPPELVIERVDFSREVVTGREVPSSLPQPVWTPLTAETLMVVKAGIEQQDFTCPFCGELHSCQDFICPRGKMLLQGVPLQAVTLIREQSFLALGSEMPGFNLESGCRVVSRDGRLYDWDGFQWVFKQEIEPYQEVANGINALYLDL